MRILINNNISGGVNKYRFSDPHNALQSAFPGEFMVDYNNSDLSNNLDYIDKFDMIIFYKVPLMVGDPFSYISKIKELGVKVVIDIDDYWRLNSSHGNYEASFQARLPYIIQGCLNLADLVITTTRYFADIIKDLNSNVVVIPNTINPLDTQFIPKPINSDKLRVGWLGGSSHLDDLKLLENLCSSNLKDVQLVLAGFDTRGNIQHYYERTGKTVLTPIQPEQSVWVKYEKLFTNNYKKLSKEQVEDMLKYSQAFNINYYSYRRIWTKDINSYAESLNELDIVLAPLVDNNFNRCKSELKLIEAGMFKLPIIASNVTPYKEIIIHGVNGYLCDKQSDFLKYVQLLQNNPKLRVELGENLNRIINEIFNFDEVTSERAIIYKRLVYGE